MGSQFRFLPKVMREHAIPAHHIVHIGGHQAEELEYYDTCGFRDVTYVEPNPALSAIISKKLSGSPYLNGLVLTAAVGATDGEHYLYVPAKTNLASTRDLGEDTISRYEVRMMGMDQLLMLINDCVPKTQPNVLVVDTQGTELEVLRTASNLSRNFDLIVCETCTVDDPDMASGYVETVNYLEECGYEVIDKWVRDYRWVYRWGHGRPTDKLGEVIDVVVKRRAEGRREDAA